MLTIILFVLFFIFWGIFLAWLMFTDSTTLWLTVAVMVGMAVFYGVLMLKIPIAQKRKEKEIYKQKMLEQKKAESMMQDIINRTWEFPVEKFYRECEKANATQLDNEFSQRKIRQTAERLIKEASPQIDLHKCEYYFKTEQITRFLDEGRQLVEKADARILEAQKTPRNASPSIEERTFIQRSTLVSSLYGNQKRVKMLSDLIEDFKTRIDGIAKGEEAMKQLSMIYMEQQKKEGDWAIAGGLAEGLAGPVAGFMAASQVVENNREIQSHNAAMRNASREILSGLMDVTSDRYKLQRQRDQAKERCEEAKEKITLSKPDSAEIWSHIQVGRYQVKKAKSGVLHIALPVHIETPLTLDVPENVNTVIDGTLKAEVQFEGKNVGSVSFPLPLYGIPTNMTTEVTLDGMLARSVEFNGEYTLKMSDSHNLWIMEA